MRARQSVAAACAKSLYFDASAGWTWNEGKGQCFARGRTGQGAAEDACTKVGKLKPFVDILGVQLSMKKVAPVVLRRKGEAMALHQLGRIALAAPSFGDVHRRRRMAAILVVPKLKWGGRFQRPPAAKVKAWDAAVRRAVLKHPRGASRAAADAVLGAATSVQFQLDLDALRHEVWRLRRSTRGLPIAEHSPGRWKEVQARWRWTPRRVPAGPIRRYDTPEGVLDLGGASKATLEGAAWRAHSRATWAAEARAKDAASQASLRAGEVMTTQLQPTHSHGSAACRRAALGCAYEHHLLEAVRQRHGMPQTTVRRACGAPARRSHWL